MAYTSCDINAAQELMDENDFNVLPVATDHPEGLIVKYWYRQERTDIPECIQVLGEDMLPGHTPIEEALDSILRSKKPFKFIRDRLRVTGLLNLSDFNGNTFRIYAFSQVVMLETLLSRYLEHKLGCEVVERQIGEKGIEQLLSDKRKGLNYSPCHYLYFKDLLQLCAKYRLYQFFGYETKSQFKALNSLNFLRNDAAHPSKTLIGDRSQAQKILERLRMVDDLSFRIRGAALPEGCL